MKKIIIGLTALFLLLPSSALASIGVGVGTGKIVVDEKLRPGLIYVLPALVVLNTGDQSSDYEVAMTYNEKQPQLKPPQSWFIFSPQHFHLDPGKIQKVEITVNLPLNVPPGDYFGYLEAHPVKVDATGVTSVNIAAAAKLYFTVIPANVFQAIYYKILSFFHVYSPWPQRVLLGIALIIGYLLFRKYFHVQINVKKADQSRKEDHE